MATRKPKLELKPPGTLSTIDLRKLHDFHAARRAPTGRIVGRRQRPDSSGLSELFVVDPDTPPKKLPIKPINFSSPDISEDGRRALFATGGDVVVVDLETQAHTKAWEGGAPLHDSWHGIMQAVFAGPDHVLLLSGWRTVLARWASADKLAPVAVVEPLERCFLAEPCRGGRVMVIKHSSQNFLIAIAGDTVHVLKKASHRKELMIVHDEHVLIGPPGGPQSEAANLDAILAALSR